MSRDLSYLEPSVRTKVAKGLELCRSRGLDVLIYQTYRSFEEQAAEYAKGRTMPGVNPTTKNPKGSPVTWAKPGESWHQWGRAIDLVPMRNGKAIWGTSGNGVDTNPADDATDDLELWERVAACFKEAGLQWGGDWPKGKQDFPHFQDPGPWTIRGLLAKYPKGLKPGAFV